MNVLSSLDLDRGSRTLADKLIEGLHICCAWASGVAFSLISLQSSSTLALGRSSF